MKEDAEEICRQFGIVSYYETSSSTGENVDEAFFSVASRAFQKTQMAAKSEDQGSHKGSILGAGSGNEEPYSYDESNNSQEDGRGRSRSVAELG